MNYPTPPPPEAQLPLSTILSEEIKGLALSNHWHTWKHEAATQTDISTTHTYTKKFEVETEVKTSSGRPPTINITSRWVKARVILPEGKDAQDQAVFELITVRKDTATTPAATETADSSRTDRFLSRTTSIKITPDNKIVVCFQAQDYHAHSGSKNLEQTAIYDCNGRLEQVTNTVAEKGSCIQTYDQHGRLTELNWQGENGESETTQYQSDEIMSPNASSWQNQIQTMTRKKIDQHGKKTTTSLEIERDGSGQITKLTTVGLNKIGQKVVYTTLSTFNAHEEKLLPTQLQEKWQTIIADSMFVFPAVYYHHLKQLPTPAEFSKEDLPDLSLDRVLTSLKQIAQQTLAQPKP